MNSHRGSIAIAIFVVLNAALAQANPFTQTVFATGAAIGATGPDSVTYGDGSLWVAYQNGAASDGSSGSSIVVRYSPFGAIQNQWTIAGNVDGLRIDPTGLVWALQNNDGNSTLTTINPVTSATQLFMYGSTYTNVANRGFDDVAFSKGMTFFSETNPPSSTDPILLALTNSLVSPPLQLTGLLNAGPITDPDSLILMPNGDLALTGEADQTIVFIHNPGTAGQSITFLPLLGVGSGLPDDTAYPTTPQGLFFYADTRANTVYEVSATGMAPGSAFIDVGNEFGSLDTSTGVVTPIFTGVSPHGLAFVPTPEPSSLCALLTVVLMCGTGGWLYKRTLQRSEQRKS
jgi:hypothetical protein